MTDAPWDDEDTTVPATSPATSSTEVDDDAQESKTSSKSRSSQRGTTMAYGGRSISADDYPRQAFPRWRSPDELLNYEPEEELDISDVSAINREILRARRRMFQVQKSLTHANRLAAEAKFEYRRARARFLVGVSGGTDKSREAMADVATEEQFGAYMVAEQVANDVLNESRAVKAELDSLANLSHNIRAQMNIQ